MFRHTDQAGGFSFLVRVLAFTAVLRRLHSSYIEETRVSPSLPRVCVCSRKRSLSATIYVRINSAVLAPQKIIGLARTVYYFRDLDQRV